MAYCGRPEKPAIPTLQIAFTHARQVGSQHSFRLPLRRRGMLRAKSDLALFQLLSLEKQRTALGHEGFDRSRPHTPTLG